ncbi:uncharacterized protein PV09_08675 [Verruconis gallopava]|uniref:BZIP domain-containing protein n=1 Tax=Verruconis gallopava TaxID=253628 RepID=A0A0D2A046_9PEZI|nr:uncharacterized protein PV09_08675 [Verruconis gallopava]KIV99684.1 hypothetical protein PV09_08675 [Verruconis gallopava]
MAGSISTSQRRSRAVATLTEAQIQHKRDIDRKAQRAFRQRTKDCISKLEQENAHMRETFKNREAALEHQIQVLREQNQALVKSLESILGLASTTLRGSSDDNAMREDSHLEEQHSEEQQICTMNSPIVQTTDSMLVNDHGRLSAIEFNTGHAGDDGISYPSNDEPDHSPKQNILNCFTYGMPPSGLAPSSSDVMAARSPASERFSPRNTDAETNLRENHGQSGHEEVSIYQASVATPLAVQRTHSVDEIVDVQISSLPLQNTKEGHIQNNGAIAIPTPSSLSTVGHRSFAEESPKHPKHGVFTAIPPFAPSVCPLDDILHNFLSSRRAMLADGVPMDAVVGPTRPSVKKLRNPENKEALHSLEELMSDVLSTYLQVKTPEKMAFFWIMNQTMRWMVSRTKESYMYMPNWLRPTATQITVPHAIWITNLPWPGVRDLLIENPEDYPYEAVGKWYTENVSINWNFDVLDAVDEVGGAERLHSIFEKHLRNLNNWTVTPAFLERFPAMVPLIHG